MKWPWQTRGMKLEMTPAQLAKEEEIRLARGRFASKVIALEHDLFYLDELAKNTLAVLNKGSDK